MTPIITHYSRHLRILSTLSERLLFSRTSFEMRSCVVLIRMNRLEKNESINTLHQKYQYCGLCMCYVYQFSSYCDAVKNLLVSYSVVSLMADARIWIIFSPWYRWQLTTHPETKLHIAQLHVNCCCYLCPRNTKTYSKHFHTHTLWRAFCVCVCVSVRALLYICPCENKLNMRVFHFCICQKVVLAGPHV